MNKKIAPLLLPLFLFGCGNTPPASKFSIEKFSNPEVQKQAEVSLSKVLVQCPKLNRYASDFYNIAASETMMSDYEGGVAVSFMVSNQPNTLPAKLSMKSAGHRCTIDVNVGATKAYIAKTACHSLCSGEIQKNDPNLMGKEYAL